MKKFIKNSLIFFLVFLISFSNILPVYATDIEGENESVITEENKESKDNEKLEENVKENNNIEENESSKNEDEKESEVIKTSIDVCFIVDDELYKEIYKEDIKETLLEEGFSIDSIDAPEKKGFEFIGWSIDKENFESFDFKVYSSDTLYIYAFYEKKVAVVNFFNTSVPIESIEVDLSGENLKIEEPDMKYIYKNYYNFLGFTTIENYNKDNIFDFNQDITKDLNLYAQYSPVNFTIMYKITINGIEKNLSLFSELKNNNRKSYTIETGKFDLIEPSMKGYIFLGWTGNNLKKETKKVTVPSDSRGALTYTMNFISGEGLYDSEFKKVMSFEELLNQGILTLSEDGVLSSNSIKNVERVNSDGDIITDDFGEAIIDKVVNSSSNILSGILILPEEGINKIDNDTFSLLSDLDRIYIPSSVTEIGDRAFKESSVKKVIFLGDGLEKIGEEAFYGCEYLDELLLPNSVSFIGNSALENINITEIFIPSSLEDFNINNLPNSLMNIYTGEDNKLYSDLDGVLVSKDNKILIKYPSGRVNNDYEVPTSIETIASNAFYNTNLEKINLGNVKNIEDFAFCDSENLKIVLNDNIENIYENSLDNIREVYYSGEKEEFLNNSFGAKSVGENHKIIFNLGNDDKIINNNKDNFHEFEEFYIKEPIRDGYTFIGWVYDNFSNPIKTFKVDKFNDQDIYLRAVWATKGNTYTIFFDKNDGSENYDKMSQEVIYLDENNSTVFKLIENKYTRDGYIFKGWSLDKDSKNVDFADGQIILENLTNKNGKISLYAVWDRETFKINYGPEKNDNPKLYSVDDEFVLQNPVKYGYKFIGWIGSCGQSPKLNVKITKGSTGDKIFLPVFKQII